MSKVLGGGDYAVSPFFFGGDMNETDGFEIKPAGWSKKVTKLAGTCQYILNERGAPNYEGAKEYFQNVLTPDDLTKYPDLLEVARAPEVVNPVTEYLGVNPYLRSMGLYITPPMAPITDNGSQYYHLDQEARYQVKVFVAVTDIDEEAGPTYFVPRIVSDLIDEKLLELSKNGKMWRYGKIKDDAWRMVCKPKYVMKFVGNSGATLFIDTSNCFHMGGRTLSKKRAVFQLQYVPAIPGSLAVMDLYEYSPGRPLTRFPTER